MLQTTSLAADVYVRSSDTRVAGVGGDSSSINPNTSNATAGNTGGGSSCGRPNTSNSTGEGIASGSACSSNPMYTRHRCFDSVDENNDKNCKHDLGSGEGRRTSMLRLLLSFAELEQPHLS